MLVNGPIFFSFKRGITNVRKLEGSSSISPLLAFIMNHCYVGCVVEHGTLHDRRSSVWRSCY